MLKVQIPLNPTTMDPHQEGGILTEAWQTEDQGASVVFTCVCAAGVLPVRGLTDTGCCIP